MYFMWIVIYFSGRYACLFWYKIEVAKAFLLHQWVCGCLGYNRFAASGIYHSWLRLVIWNKFAIQVIGFMKGLFYYWFYTTVLCHGWCRLGANIVLCIVFVTESIQPCPCLKANNNFWLLVVLLLNPINWMECCKLYYLLCFGWYVIIDRDSGSLIYPFLG